VVVGTLSFAAGWYESNACRADEVEYTSPFTENAGAQKKQKGFSALKSKITSFFRRKKSTPIITDDPLSLANKVEHPDPGLFVSMARVQENSDHADIAASNYLQALNVDNNYLDALLGYGRLLDRQGKLAEANEIYKRAVAAHPKEPTAYNDLALCLARRGMYQESVSVFQQAITLAPTDKRYRNNLATVLVRTGASAEAVRILQGANDAAVAHYNVGFLLQKEGRHAEAIEQFKSALAANPRLLAAQQWIDRLSKANPALASGSSSQLASGNSSPTFGSHVPQLQTVAQLRAPVPSPRPSYLDHRNRSKVLPSKNLEGPMLAPRQPISGSNGTIRVPGRKAPNGDWGVPPSPNDPFGTKGPNANPPAPLPAVDTEFYSTGRF